MKKQRADVEYLRQTGLRSFRFFTRNLLGLYFSEEEYGDILDILQEPDWDILIWAMSRGTAKTTIACAWEAWNIVRDRNERAFVYSAREERGSEDFQSLVQKYLEKPLIVELYGDFHGRTWNKNEFEVSGKEDVWKEPTLRSYGRNSFHAGGHFRRRFFDDAENQDTTRTPDLIAWGRNIDSLAFPMADQPPSQHLYLGTFWDANDLLSWKIDQLGLYETVSLDEGRTHKVPKDGKRVVTEIPGAPTEKPLRVRLIYKPCFLDDGVTPRFPSLLPARNIAIARQTMTAYQFACHYLLTPISTENAIFLPDWFRYGPEPPGRKNVWIGVDIARSHNVFADNTGICVLSVSNEYRFHVREAIREKMDGKALVEKLFELDEKYEALGEKPRFAIEEDGYGAGIKIYLTEVERERRKYLRIEWINAHARTNKAWRIEATSVVFSDGRISLSPGTQDLEEELLPWTREGSKGRFRDLADAFANAYECAQRSNFTEEKPKSQVELLLKRLGVSSDRGDPNRMTTKRRTSLSY